MCNLYFHTLVRKSQEFSLCFGCDTCHWPQIASPSITKLHQRVQVVVDLFLQRNIYICTQRTMLIYQGVKHLIKLLHSRWSSNSSFSAKLECMQSTHRALSTSSSCSRDVTWTSTWSLVASERSSFPSPTCSTSQGTTSLPTEWIGGCLLLVLWNKAVCRETLLVTPCLVGVWSWWINAFST